MPIPYDPLDLSHLDVLDDLRAMLARAARDVHADGARGEARVTLTLTVEVCGDAQVMVQPHLGYKPPKNAPRQSVVADIAPSGELVTQAGRQGALDLDNVRRINGGD